MSTAPSAHILSTFAVGAAGGQSLARGWPFGRRWAHPLAFITVRSLIHLLLPDGGAQSIASIDVHVAGVLLRKNWQGASRESRGRSLG